MYKLLVRNANKLFQIKILQQNSHPFGLKKQHPQLNKPVQHFTACSSCEPPTMKITNVGLDKTKENSPKSLINRPLHVYATTSKGKKLL